MSFEVLASGTTGSGTRVFIEHDPDAEDPRLGPYAVYGTYRVFVDGEEVPVVRVDYLRDGGSRYVELEDGRWMSRPARTRGNPELLWFLDGEPVR
jgi:hypothetical protein